MSREMEDSKDKLVIARRKRANISRIFSFVAGVIGLIGLKFFNCG